MPKTGINFQRCNCGSAVAHNRRDKDYLDALERSGKKTYDIFHDRTRENTSWTNPAYAGKSLEQILTECRERYTAHTGQAPQEEDRVRVITDRKTGMKKTVTTAGWSPIREGVCPVKEGTTLQDFMPFVAWLEHKGVHVISIHLHRDEGHQEQATGERKYNLHAHVIADWTDHGTGKTAKLSKLDTSAMQTVLARALAMERGESKEKTGADHLTPAQQREKAASEHAAQLEQKVADLEQQISTDAKAHRAELTIVCNNLQRIGRHTVKHFDWLQKFGIEQLKPTAKEQETRDQLEEACGHDLTDMQAPKLMQEQSLLRTLIANTQKAVGRIGDRLQKLATGIEFWKKPRLAHEAKIQGEKDAAIREAAQAKAEAQKAVKSAENAQSAAESAEANAEELARQHREALRTLDADKEAARKAGAAAKHQEWTKWADEVADPAIKERDELREEKEGWQRERSAWLQDFRNIAKALVSHWDDETVQAFEKQGLPGMIGPDIWQQAKKPEKKQSRGNTPHV